MKAAITHQIIPIGPIEPTIQAIRANTNEANAPASVPSKLTAPSVPLGTDFKVVIR